MSRKKKKKEPTYQHVAKVSLHEMFPLIGETEVEVAGQTVRLRSLRLRTFKEKGTKCASCGLEATFFGVDNFIRNPQPRCHVNLWGVDEDGKEVLFTHDHIIPKAAGGKDHINNTQTMCTRCNGKKADKTNLKVYRDAVVAMWELATDAEAVDGDAIDRFVKEFQEVYEQAKKEQESDV